MSFRTTLILFFTALIMTGCANYDFSRRCVQQGNILSKPRVDRLRIGMSKSDVAILMGTSAISPLFNDNRWDYAYTWRQNNKPMIIRHLVLTFQHDKLVSIDRTPISDKPALQSSSLAPKV